MYWELSETLREEKNLLKFNLLRITFLNRLFWNVYLSWKCVVFSEGSQRSILIKFSFFFSLRQYPLLCELISPLWLGSGCHPGAFWVGPYTLYPVLVPLHILCNTKALLCWRPEASVISPHSEQREFNEPPTKKDLVWKLGSFLLLIQDIWFVQCKCKKITCLCWRKLE